MTIETFEIASYRVSLVQNARTAGSVHFSALIACQGEGVTLYLYFLRPESRVWEDQFWPDRRMGKSFLPEEQYPWYIDLLRNEKPLFARLDSDPKGANYIYSGHEMTGEEETPFSVAADPE